MEATVAKIKKNNSAEIWVCLREYLSTQYVDIREHFFSNDDQDWHPTKKGIMVPRNLLSQVTDGVLALEDAKDIGTVATVEKSDVDEIQTGVREFQRSRYGEVRVWYLVRNGERKPSKKGVTFNLELVETLTAALRDAGSLLDQKSSKVSQRAL